jgi:hypothetical protein
MPFPLAWEHLGVLPRLGRQLTSARSHALFAGMWGLSLCSFPSCPAVGSARHLTHDARRTTHDTRRCHVRLLGARGGLVIVLAAGTRSRRSFYFVFCISSLIVPFPSLRWPRTVCAPCFVAASLSPGCERRLRSVRDAMDHTGKPRTRVPHPQLSLPRWGIRRMMLPCPFTSGWPPLCDGRLGGRAACSTGLFLFLFVFYFVTDRSFR